MVRQCLSVKYSETMRNYYQSYSKRTVQNTGLLKMVVVVLTTCHTQDT
jgi:hypothetical protein